MEAAIPIKDINSTWAIIFLVLCILGVAFFSSSEAALISANKIKIRHLADQGSKAAQTILKILEKHDLLFGTILATENMLIIFASSIGTVLVISHFGHQSVLLASLIMTCIIVIFGEITPKTIAAMHAERYSLLVARAIAFIIFVLRPIISVATFFTKLIMRLFGIKKVYLPFVTEDEIKTMINISQEEGLLPQEEKEMLHNVFDFGDVTVKKIMLPRTDMVAVKYSSTINNVLEKMVKHGHSRFPVYMNNEDEIIGIIYVKDILRSMYHEKVTKEATIKDFIRPAYFVPENTKAKEVFRNLKQKKIQMAFVLDEYGGTAGLVTMEDLLEEIVGSIQDEYDHEAANVQAIDEKTFVANGDTPMEEIAQAIPDVNFDIPEGDFQTLGGFIIHLLGDIPKEKEEINYDSLKFIITEIKGPRIRKVSIIKKS